jgi:hypothetical protein
MKTFKIVLHSTVDLITNSSTVIFTYSQGSQEAVKNLVNEMLKVFGHEDKTFDDLFYAEIFSEDDCNYFYDKRFKEVAGTSNISDYKEERKISEKFLNALKLQIIKKEIEKPAWMIEIEEEESHCGCFAASNALELLPKDEKYLELSNQLLKFLYSTNHEGTRD